jgi:hypothetical protein
MRCIDSFGKCDFVVFGIVVVVEGKKEKRSS